MSQMGGSTEIVYCESCTGSCPKAAVPFARSIRLGGLITRCTRLWGPGRLTRTHRAGELVWVRDDCSMKCPVCRKEPK